MMNKEGWEIKRLGELCDILDYKRKPVTKKDRKKGIYPYYGATGIQDYVHDYIFDGTYVLVGEDGAKWNSKDNTAFLVEGKCWVNNHVHVLKINNLTVDKWVIYYLNYKDLNEYITGAVIPKLNQASLRNIPIPVPSLPIQEQIVAELDTLNDILAKKRQQLTELDTLAQATFYHLFGDPVENERGWEVKRLEEVCTKIYGGGTPPKTNNLYYEGGNILWVTPKDMKFKFISDSQIKITPLGVKNSSAKIVPSGAILIVLRSGILKHTLPIGIATKDLTINQDLKAFVGNSLINNIFFYGCLKALESYLLTNVRAVTADNIEFSIIKNLNLPLPLLALQNQFAEQIEAIEKQKELINQSITEVQKLLDYTMDKYFN